mgnify:FL=1
MSACRVDLLIDSDFVIADIGPAVSPITRQNATLLGRLYFTADAMGGLYPVDRLSLELFLDSALHPFEEGCNRQAFRCNSALPLEVRSSSGRMNLFIARSATSALRTEP